MDYFYNKNCNDEMFFIDGNEIYVTNNRITIECNAITVSTTHSVTLSTVHIRATRLVKKSVNIEITFLLANMYLRHALRLKPQARK